MKRLISSSLVAGILVGFSFTLSGCVALVPLIEPDYQPKQGLFGPVQSSEACPLPQTQLNAQPATKRILKSKPIRVTSEQSDQMAEAQAFVAAHVEPERKRRVNKRQARLQKLIRQLKAVTAVARTHAASDIGFMGSYAVSAVAPLSFALKYDDNKWVRRAAAKSLGKIGGAEVVAPLRGALRDRNKWVAHSAGNALRKVEQQLGYSRQRLQNGSNSKTYRGSDFRRSNGKAPTFRARGNQVQKY